MALLETQITPGWMIHWLTPVNIVDPASAASNVNMVTTPHVQQSVTPVSFVSTTQVWMDVPVPPTVNTIIPPVSTTRVPLLQIPSVASTTNTLPSSQPQEQNVDPAGNVERRLTQQTGVAKGSSVKTVKVRTMALGSAPCSTCT